MSLTKSSNTSPLNRWCKRLFILYSQNGTLKEKKTLGYMLSDSFRQQKSTGHTSADSYLMQVTESAEVCRMDKILSQSRTIFLMYCISTILMWCTYKQTPLVQIQPIHYLKEFGCSLLWRSWWSSGLISPWIQLYISSLHWLLVYNMFITIIIQNSYKGLDIPVQVFHKFKSMNAEKLS